MKLMIASNNEHKIREIKAIVGGYFDEVLSQREAGETLDVEENGSTFAENALLKAQALFDVTGCAALADDDYAAVCTSKRKSSARFLAAQFFAYWEKRR